MTSSDCEKTACYSRRVIALQAVSPPGLLSETRLQEQTAYSLGRAGDNAIVLDHDTVSRHHAELRFVNGRFVIADRGSGNGVVVSGRRVGEQVLADGDRVELGECVLEFRDSDTVPSRTDWRALPVPDEVAERVQASPAAARRPWRAARLGMARLPAATPKLALLACGVVLIGVVLLVAFQRGSRPRRAVETSSPGLTPVAPPSAPQASEEIEQRLAKASAQYQAGQLGQALEEYRRAIEAGAADQDVRRTYEQIAREFEQRLQSQLTRADEYEKHLQYRSAISELQGAMALIGEVQDARLADIQSRVSRLQQRL